jgi:hypothetical protein
VYCKLDTERERNRWKRDGSLGQPLKSNPEWCKVVLRIQASHRFQPSRDINGLVTCVAKTIPPPISGVSPHIVQTHTSEETVPTPFSTLPVSAVSDSCFAVSAEPCSPASEPASPLLQLNTPSVSAPPSSATAPHSSREDRAKRGWPRQGARNGVVLACKQKDPALSSLSHALALSRSRSRSLALSRSRSLALSLARALYIFLLLFPSPY